MEIRPARQHRQGLVGGVAAEVGSQIHGVPGVAQEAQIGPVGVVHQQQGPPGVAELRQGLQLRQEAQIVRAAEIHRLGPGLLQGRRQGLRRGLGGEIGALRQRQPADLQIQQSRRGQKGLVDVPGGQYAKAFRICHCEASAHTGCGNPFSLVPRCIIHHLIRHPACGGRRMPPSPQGEGFGALHRQQQHRPDAVGRALRGIKRGAAKEPGGVGLAFGNDPGGLIEGVGPGDLRQIQLLAAQGPPPLVARHMEAGGAEVTITGNEVMDGCVHK